MNTIPTFPIDAAAPDARDWGKIISTYCRSDDRRAAIELAITFLPYAALWTTTWLLLSAGHWWGMALVIPAGLLLMRLFMIQHDCGHSSYFSSSKVNNLVGRLIGVLTLTPFSLWRRAHALHHAGSGNLTRRGFGDILTLTIDEYQSRSFLGRLQYRLYRHPLILFGLGPSYIFIIDHRFPFGQWRDGWMPWLSTMGTNLGMVLVYGALIWLMGWKLFFLIQMPITVIAGSIGMWLFYVQHQFEDTLWEHDQNWDRHEAALYGSSYFDFPQPIRWFTGNIGVHHVHHLSSRIPFYKLTDVLKDYPDLANINRFTLRDSLSCIGLALWDEGSRKLVSFRTAAHACA